MRTITELNEQELIKYSKILVTLTNVLLQDRKFAMNFMSGVKGKKYVNFPIDGIGIMRFDREERQFSYGDVLIPKGILDNVIEYS